MTRNVMSMLYKELASNGFSFTEQGYRFLSEIHGGKDDYVSYGVLRKKDGCAFTPEDLHLILGIARHKHTHVVQLQATPLRDNGIQLGFIQRGLLQMIAAARAPVTELLRKSFGYCQEEESILSLERTLEQLQWEMDLFESQTRDVHALERSSTHFRTFLQKELDACLYIKDMLAHIEDSDYREWVRTLHLGINVLRLLG